MRYEIPKIPAYGYQRPTSYKGQLEQVKDNLEIGNRQQKYKKPLMEGGQLQVGESMSTVSGMKYVMGQMAALEEQIRSIKMRQDYYIEEDRGYREKLESGFRTVNEQTSLLVNDLMNRVVVLDDALKKEETRTSLLMQKVN